MVAAPEKTTEMKEVVAVEESTENSRPKDVAMAKEDNESKSKKAVERMALGKKAMLLNEPQEAVEHFAEACALMSRVYGDMSKEMCDYHFNYGKALLEVARLEENVLGNALSGVPEDSGLDDSQVEDPDKLTVEEKEEVADEVDKALAENFKVGNKKVETEAEKSDEKKADEKSDEKKADEKSDEKKADEKSDEKKEAVKSAEKKEAVKSAEKKEAVKSAEKKEAEKSDEKKEAEKSDDKKEKSPVDEKKSEGEDVESEMETDEVVAEKKDDAADKPESEEKEDSEEENAEEDAMEEDAASDAAIADDDSQESSQEEDVSTLQLAYEVLEISKTIYERIDEKTEEEKLKLSQVYLKLGEVASENEQYEESVTQYELCLKLQETLLPADDRLLAETNYQLGLAHSFADDYDPALKHIESAVAIFKTRISNKTDFLAKKDITIKDGMDVSKLDADVKQVVNEVGEMQKVLPDLEEKITDIKETKASCMEKLKAMKNTLMSAFGEAADASASAFGASGFEAKESNGSEAPAAKPISTNMIRKKRKPEDEVDTEEPSKKPRTESSNGADKEEAQTDEVKPTEK